MKEYNNPKINIAFFESENVVTKSGDVPPYVPPEKKTTEMDEGDDNW